MRKIILIFLMVVISLSAVAAAGGPYDKYLTAKDVEKVSGLKGVKSIPKKISIGAGGDLNFATSSNKMIVMVQVLPKFSYDSYKYCFKADVKGLGDQAMQGATFPKKPSNVVAFTKGSRCIALTTFMDEKNPGNNMLMIEQIIELAKKIASRL